MFTYAKFEAICIALRIHKKAAGSLAGGGDAYVYMRTFFNPRKLQRAAPTSKKQKKCIHYIYTKYPFFMFKKCIHYIYTRNHTSSRQQPFQRLHHYSPTPQTCWQQAEIWQITTNHYCSPTKTHTHILQAAELSIQRSKAKVTARPLQHGKKGTYSPSRRHIHIFSPTFPASFKTADREYTSGRRRKKRKKGIKRHKKVLKGDKRYKKWVKGIKREKKGYTKDKDFQQEYG